LRLAWRMARLKPCRCYKAPRRMFTGHKARLKLCCCYKAPRQMFPGRMGGLKACSFYRTPRIEFVLCSQDWTMLRVDGCSGGDFLQRAGEWTGVDGFPGFKSGT